MIVNAITRLLQPFRQDLSRQLQQEKADHWQTQTILDATYRISQAAHTTHDLPELYQAIHRIIQELMPAQNFYIALYNAATDTLTFPYQRDEFDQYQSVQGGKGITCYVVRTAEPLLATPEVLQQLLDSGQVALCGTRGIDWLGVPLISGRAVIGVIAVQTYTETTRLTERDKTILTFVSGQVGMAIERKQSEEQINRRNLELILLNRIIAITAGSTEPEIILETTCRELALGTEIPLVNAALVNEQKTRFTITAEYLKDGIASMIGQELPIQQPNPLISHLFNNKTPLIINNVDTDPRLEVIREVIKTYHITSLMIIPLLNAHEVLGCINLATTTLHQFTTNEINLIWSIAEQVSGGLVRTRLNKLSRLLSAAVEQSADSVIITDADGIIGYVNSTFEQTSGYSRHEVIRKTPDILRSGSHPDEFYASAWNTLTAGKIWRGKVINRKKNGTLYTEEVSINPVRNQNGEITNYVSIQHDITSRLNLEEQYYQAQKMESIGRLTGGIAHDFNNLLTAINGFAELLQARLPPDPKLHAMVNNILNAGNRAANLVRQLLIFSRKQIIEPKILDMNTIVANIDKMLQHIIGEDIRLSIHLSPTPWSVKLDPAQLEQVIVNLAVNARDAMPNGGQLLLETANMLLTEDYTGRHLEVIPGEYVMLAVTDTGVGMTDEVKTHIFEPFFTTKPSGKGTGLGLATIFGIVKQSNGHIWVYSELGKGTTFKIYFPRVTDQAPTRSTLQLPTDLPTGTETILLVEDETMAREFSSQILQEYGYTLLEAANAAEAIHLAKAYKAKIHLLLTDVVMPEMNGKEMVDSLMPIRTDLKVIFMSGYTEDTIVHHGVLDEGIHFLAKPFSSTDLLTRIRTVLDEKTV